MLGQWCEGCDVVGSLQFDQVVVEDLFQYLGGDVQFVVVYLFGYQVGVVQGVFGVVYCCYFQYDVGLYVVCWNFFVMEEYGVEVVLGLGMVLQ